MPARSMARSSIVAGALFVAAALRLRNAPEGEATERAAKALFGYSILYLVLLFAVLLIDQGFGGRSDGCRGERRER